jgi:hypothetical protein
MELYFPIVGTIFLLFRLWLCEIKLHEVLGNKRGHTSRFISYYFGLAMILNFSVNVFTLISVISAPAMIFAVLYFDISFFLNEGREDIPLKFWQIVERLTLHIPLIVFGIFYYAYSPALEYFQLFTIPKFGVALLLAGIPMFGFDPRISKKADWPRGPFILGGAILDIIGNIWFFLNLAQTRGYFEELGITVALGLT